MPPPSLREVELSLIMAFGQGSGSMMATPEALIQGLSSQPEIIARAQEHWDSARFTIHELVRLAGQIAAARSAKDGLPEIDAAHAAEALAIVLDLCPSLQLFGRH